MHDWAIATRLYPAMRKGGGCLTAMDQNMEHSYVSTVKMSLYPSLREGVGYVKTQLSCILFIMLTTTCFGHCGPSSGHKMYKEENYTQYGHSRCAYSKLSTRSRRLEYPKFR